MKVLVVSSWFPPVRSGSSLWAESLALALGRRGHEVKVVTTTWRGAGDGGAGAGGGEVLRLPARLLPRNRLVLGLSIVPIAWSSENRRRMLGIVRSFRPDVIHQVSHIHDTVFLSAAAARATGTPLVGSITTPIQSGSPLLHRLMHAVDLSLTFRFGVSRWDRIICSDSTQARYARDAYGPPAARRIVTHIPVGVHERVREAKPEPRTSEPRIVTVGHVHAFRNPTNLVRAMPAILAKFPGAKLDIAGRVQLADPEREVDRLGLKSCVRFLGEVSPEEVGGLVSRAWVFAVLHQMRYAGLSFTAIEAMQFGTPVVINAPEDLYGPGEIVDGGNIVLVSRDDPAEIASRIVDLLADPFRRDRIGLSGQRFVAGALRWDLNAERTEELYAEILRSRRRGTSGPKGAMSR